MEATQEATKRHTYYIRPSLHQTLRYLALEKRMTISALVELSMIRLLSAADDDLKGEYRDGR